MSLKFKKSIEEELSEAVATLLSNQLNRRRNKNAVQSLKPFFRNKKYKKLCKIYYPVDNEFVNQGHGIRVSRNFQPPKKKEEK